VDIYTKYYHGLIKINKLAQPQSGWRLVNAETHIVLVNVEMWLAAGERCKVAGGW